jgi:hypothetical protein
VFNRLIFTADWQSVQILELSRFVDKKTPSLAMSNSQNLSTEWLPRLRRIYTDNMRQLIHHSTAIESQNFIPAQTEYNEQLNEEVQMFDTRFRNLRERKAAKPTLKGKVYNFLERPSGWRCFIYHFSVRKLNTLILQ